MNILILTLDFGSNSNKYLLSIYNKGTLTILEKGSFIHKNKTEAILEKYESNLEKFISKIEKSIQFFKNKFKPSKIITKAVGTEFYRTKSKNRDQIIEINNKLLSRINTDLEIISQEKESYLSNKVIELFFEDYLIIDLGGGSTEIVIKNKNKYHRFLYKFGCLTYNLSKDSIEDFLEFYKKNNTSNIILIGGSFIATLLSIKKIKNKKLFYKLSTNQIKKFYSNIKQLDENEILQKYPALKGREISIKSALEFILNLLIKTNINKVNISLATILEGLAIDLLEFNKLELRKLGIKLEERKETI